MRYCNALLVFLIYWCKYKQERTFAMTRKHQEEPEPEQNHDQWLADQMNISELDWENMTPEEYEAAQAYLQLMGSEYTEDWQIGQSIGTVPHTPWETEGDTDEHKSIRKK
jgi:hypothetical protein